MDLQADLSMPTCSYCLIWADKRLGPEYIEITRRVFFDAKFTRQGFENTC